MLIILGLVLAGLIVIIAAYRFLSLWLTWIDSKAPDSDTAEHSPKGDN